jgi:predicted RND superfamily exporter protein
MMLWVVGHPKTTLALALVALIGCVGLAVLKLGISTNQDELFSSKVAFFKDYLEFTNDFPENQASYVLIDDVDPGHPPTVEQWVAVADAITSALAADTAHVRAVDSHIPIKELNNQGVLFESSTQLHSDFDDLQKLSVPFRPTNFLNGSMGNTPLLRFFNAMQPGGIGGQTPTAQSTQFTSLMASGMTMALKDPSAPIEIGKQVPDLDKLGQTDPSQLGYYYVADQEVQGNYLELVRVYERNDFTQSDSLINAIDAIRQTIAKAAAPFPQFTVALTGRPALEADESATTNRDARYSEIAALTAVFIGLMLLLRSIWAAVAAEIALLVGIGLTFGWATVSVHKLNLLSMVFLIALTGIGMDYLIQVLTRYRRESARRVSPRGIWTGVFKYVAAPINTACLGAAGAFFVSIFTNFRGAAELGIVASGGLLLCLLCGYIILPPLLTLFPVKPRPEDAERSSEFEDKHASPGKPENPAVLEHHAASLAGSRLRNLWLAPPFVWAILLLIGIPFGRRAQFNPSLLKMQAQSLQSVQLIHKLQTWSAAVLVDPAQIDTLRQVRDAVEKLPVVDNTESVLTAYDNYHWLTEHRANPITRTDYDPIRPDDLPKLSASITKLAAAIRSASTIEPTFVAATHDLENLTAAIHQVAPELAANRLSAWQQGFIEEVKSELAQFTPDPPDLSHVPASLRDHLQGIAHDNKPGKIALYINPKQDLWKQSALADFVHQVETAVAKVPGAPPATGIAINVYHSTSDIESSFYHATGYALGLIFVLVLIDLRNLSQTLLAISVLAMGLPMLVALMGLLHIDWNFANFFGLPILIGAGHEYGVFMVHRYNEACADPHRRWRAWDVSDKALLLCGYVTSVSFGFFWLLGHHEGLKSLGLVMALGTACIYLATLCVLRPLLLWKLGRRESGCKPG